jgi:hypothetical protein
MHVACLFVVAGGLLQLIELGGQVQDGVDMGVPLSRQVRVYDPFWYQSLCFTCAASTHLFGCFFGGVTSFCSTWLARLNSRHNLL